MAEEYDRRLRQACELAALVGVDRLTLLGGLPEGSPGDTTQAWVVARFPPYDGRICAGNVRSVPCRTGSGAGVSHRRVRAWRGILDRPGVGPARGRLRRYRLGRERTSTSNGGEGLEKACRFLKAILVEKEAYPPWWEYEPSERQRD